jgi:hypothetical protein
MRLLGLLLLVTAATAAVFAQGPSSVENIRALVTSGDYRTALQKIHKELAGSIQDQPNRYELLMLQGECQLQLRDRIGAATAFKSAAKAAADVSQLTAARAHALIVERSTMGRYLPRPGARADEAIDIMLIDPRKQAMMAYREELWSQCQPQLAAALRADQLPPIEKVFVRLADVYCLERFATDADGDAKQALQDLGSHALNLMRSELLKLGNRVDYLTLVANSSSDNNGWNSGRMGLTSQQRDEVKAMLPYLNEIRERATEYRQVAAKLGGDEAKWSTLVADAVAATSDAQSLYNDR